MAFIHLVYANNSYVLNTDEIHHIHIGKNEDYEGSIATIYMKGYKDLDAMGFYSGLTNDCVGAGTKTVIDNGLIFPIYHAETIKEIADIIGVKSLDA